MDRGYYSIRAAAEYLKKDRRYVRRLIREGALTPLRLPHTKHPVIHRRELDSLGVPEKWVK